MKTMKKLQHLETKLIKKKRIKLFIPKKIMKKILIILALFIASFSFGQDLNQETFQVVDDIKSKHHRKNT